MTVEGGDEDDQRHPGGADRAHDVQAGDFGHLHVEEDKVGRGWGAQQADCFVAVGGLGDVDRAGLAREQVGQAASRGWFVGGMGAR